MYVLRKVASRALMPGARGLGKPPPLPRTDHPFPVSHAAKGNLGSWTNMAVAQKTGNPNWVALSGTMDQNLRNPIVWF